MSVQMKFLESFVYHSLFGGSHLLQKKNSVVCSTPAILDEALLETFGIADLPLFGKFA
jgi:hypothetical protein